MIIIQQSQENMIRVARTLKGGEIALMGHVTASEIKVDTPIPILINIHRKNCCWLKRSSNDMVMKAWLKFMCHVSETAISVATTHCVKQICKKVWFLRRPHPLKLIFNQNRNQLMSIILVKRFKLILNMFPIIVFCGIVMGSDITR